ncbi:MAG: hypothetical protein NTX59_11035 [Elusimicrobia bacterium]|nr:hypothetical protein [Elusimicrobiota bacterium]
MNSKLIIGLVCLGFVASANAAVNFDQGVDVKSVIQQAKTSDTVIPAAKFGMPVYISRDCKNITFGPSDPLTSAVVPLSSREEDQDCQNMGPYVGQICTPSFQNYSADAQIVVTEPRVLQPGQKEVFEVCLWGSFLSMKPVTTVYKYSVNRVLDVFQITPKGPIQAAAKAAPAQDVCQLAMDDGHFCTYRCKDGSYISNPNPFPTIPSPSPWVGPISTPCRPTVPNTPLITIIK